MSVSKWKNPFEQFKHSEDMDSILAKGPNAWRYAVMDHDGSRSQDTTG